MKPTSSGLHIFLWVLYLQQMSRLRKFQVFTNHMSHSRNQPVDHSFWHESLFLMEQPCFLYGYTLSSSHCSWSCWSVSWLSSSCSPADACSTRKSGLGERFAKLVGWPPLWWQEPTVIMDISHFNSCHSGWPTEKWGIRKIRTTLSKYS